MVVELSKRTKMPVEDLVYTFGKHLATVFASKFKSFFEECSNTKDFLKTIDNHIHVEVQKLYPDAELPKFSYDDSDPDNFILHYESSRPFAPLAKGLIEGCAEFYNEKITVEIKNNHSTEEVSDVEFVIRMVA